LVQALGDAGERQVADVACGAAHATVEGGAGKA
jgi:hypothetical protein